jgi:hypothetical protein
VEFNKKGSRCEPFLLWTSRYNAIKNAIKKAAKNIHALSKAIA